jgi:hypothetical protein
MDTGLTLSLENWRSSAVWVLLSAGWFFILGLVGGFATGLAAALTGALFWWLFIERRKVMTNRQGALVGFLIQAAAYPVAYLLSGILGIQAGVGSQPTFTYSGLVPSGPKVIEILVNTVIWTIIHYYGVILTGPIGIAGGVILVVLRRRFSPEPKTQ